MFAVHTRIHHRHHPDGWAIADRTAAALAIVAVLFAAAWAGMTF